MNYFALLNLGIFTGHRGNKIKEGRATPENDRARENLLSTAGVISIHRFINTLVTWHRLQELSFYSLQIFKSDSAWFNTTVGLWEQFFLSKRFSGPGVLQSNPRSPKKYSCHGLTKLCKGNINERKFMRFKIRPPPRPHNFSNGPFVKPLDLEQHLGSI